MSKKSVRQDLILKGLDPANVVVGEDGLFIAKNDAAVILRSDTVEANTNEEKKLKNAFVMLEDNTSVKEKKKQQKTK